VLEKHWEKEIAHIHMDDREMRLLKSANENIFDLNIPAYLKSVIKPETANLKNFKIFSNLERLI
jgi:hypothetical protein